MLKNNFYGRPLRRENLLSSPSSDYPQSPSAPSPIDLLTSIPLPQAETVGIHIHHSPRVTAVSRDPESQHNGRLADELVQEQQPGLAIHGQLKRPDQTPRRRIDAVVRRGPGVLDRRVDAKHVDLALALVGDHVLRGEVEFEAKGAGAGAGQVGKEDDEVDLTRVARSFGDLEVEWIAGGVGGVGAQGEGEVLGSARIVGEDGVRRARCEGLAALLGGGKGWEDGEEREGGAEREMHCGRLKSASDAVFRVVGGPTSQAASQC